jgi:predicted HAD superfamily Cof-like phosphohydrolase
MDSLSRHEKSEEEMAMEAKDNPNADHDGPIKSDFSYDNDVGRFHEKFGLPVTGKSPPRLLSPAVLVFREKFLQEELDEFREAHAAGDLEKCLDALCDLAWVAIGTAHYMGLPFDAGWREIRRANMEKVLASSDPNKPYRTDFVVKPPGWRGPDHATVLERHCRNHGLLYPERQAEVANSSADSPAGSNWGGE